MKSIAVHAAVVAGNNDIWSWGDSMSSHVTTLVKSAAVALVSILILWAIYKHKLGIAGIVAAFAGGVLAIWFVSNAGSSNVQDKIGNTVIPNGLPAPTQVVSPPQPPFSI